MTVTVEAKKKTITKIVNCCPHTVNVFSGAMFDPSIGKSRGGDISATFPPCGLVATAKSTISLLPKLEINNIEIPLCKRAFARVTPLPTTESDSLFIVSSLYAEACKQLGTVDMSRLLTPYGQVVNDSGKIIGCTGLIQYD